MVEKRWNEAQKYEKKWWDSKKKEIITTFYANFAEKLIDDLDGILEIKLDTSVLEIGSGAAGTITYINSNVKYAIDPLEYYYSTIEAFTKNRDSRVKYFTAKGEELPFESEKFDLIIIDNVLDHCSDPMKVISEMRRTLKKGGIIYFRQNTYHIWGLFVRTLMEKISFDKGHPFTFTKKYLENQFLSNNFSILKFTHYGYFSTWKKEFFTLKVKEIAKALLFATRDKTLFVLRRN